MTRGGLVLLLGSLVGVATGCAGSWPTVQASGEAPFIDGAAPVRTVDVMPSDVQVWARKGESTPEDQIGAHLDANIASVVPVLLAEKGYQVVANLDWNGTYIAPDGQPRHAIEAQEMVETAWALSSYGSATMRAKRRGLVPHLPHRLGAKTGSDATLYIGGWAYAGKKPESGGSKALKVVAIVLVVAVVAITVAAILDGKGGGIGKIGGKVAKGAGKAAGAAGRVAGGIGRAAIRVASSTTRVMARAATSIDTIHFDFTMNNTDSFGRVDTHSSWYRGRPDFYSQPTTPRSGPSASMIEMTLVDNRRGVVLWHASQRFPADPKRTKDIQKMMGSMIAALPEVSRGSLAPGAIAGR